MPSLLSLPNEVILPILSYTPSIPEEKQRTLKNLCITCKRLQPLAQEILLQQPCVNMNLLPSLISAYKKNSSPAQAKKVKSLEIRAPKHHGCARTIQTGRLAISTITNLRNLFIILPNLDTLLLGANRMQDIIPLHYIFLGKGNIYCTHHGYTAPSAPNPLALASAAIFPALPTRLTALEMPAVWTQIWNGRTKMYTPYSSEWYLADYARLTHLTVSGRAFDTVLETAYRSFPACVTHLSVSNVEDVQVYTLVRRACRYLDNTTGLRRLVRIEIWAHDGLTAYGRGEWPQDPWWGMGCSKTEWLCKCLKDEHGVEIVIRYEEQEGEIGRLLGKERRRRRTADLQYFALEARGCFEGMRKAVELEKRERARAARERWMGKREGHRKRRQIVDG